MKKGFIGSLMVQHGYLRPEQLARAQQIQKRQGGQLDEILIGTGMLSESEYQQCLARLYGLSYYSLEALLSAPMSSSLLAKVSYRTAMTHLLLPLRMTDSPVQLHVVAQAPLKRDVKLGLMRQTGADEVVVALGTREHLLDAIRYHYGAHMAVRATQRSRQVQASSLDSSAELPLDASSSDSLEDISVFSLHREGFCPSCGVPYQVGATTCGRCGRSEEQARLDPYIGRVLGQRWKIMRLVSQGGMGLIYQARDLEQPRDVAVKLLRNQFRTSDVEIQRFQNEAKILQHLQHHNIVETFEFGHESPLGFYLVMELLHGQDLYEYQFRMTLPLSLLCSIFCQVCDGMSHAHQKGIIHRDLKPENIFLVGGIEKFEGVRVFDFGIAKLMEGQQRLTQPGIVMGTPEYIAPEQAQNRGVDHRTDVYALSVIFYEFLAGERLFDADNAFAYLMKHVYAKPQPLSERCRRDIPAALEELIMRGLSKEPEDRIQSMEEYKEALLCIQAELELAVPSVPAIDVCEPVMCEQEAIPTQPITTRPSMSLSVVQGAVLPPVSTIPPSPFARSLHMKADEFDPAAAPTQPEPLPGPLFDHVTIPLLEVSSEPTGASLERRTDPRWLFGLVAVMLMMLSVMVWLTQLGR